MKTAGRQAGGKVSDCFVVSLASFEYLCTMSERNLASSFSVFVQQRHNTFFFSCGCVFVFLWIFYRVGRRWLCARSCSHRSITYQ